MVKKLRLATLFLIAAIFTFGVVANLIKPQPTQSTKTNQQEKPAGNMEVKNPTVQVSVIFDNQEIDGEIPLNEEKTAYQALVELLEKANISYEAKEYDFGIFVESINKLETNEDMAWIYFVNGNSGNVSADTYILNDGDVLEWKYIEPQIPEESL